MLNLFLQDILIIFNKLFKVANKILNQKLINPDMGPDHNKYQYDTLVHGTHYGRPQGRTTFFTSSGKNIVTHLSGKQLNNFYVVVVEIYRTRGKDYNQASVHFVTGFKEEDKKPTPIYQKMTIANSSGSKFATKLEFDGFSPKNKIGMWAA